MAMPKLVVTEIDPEVDVEPLVRDQRMPRDQRSVGLGRRRRGIVLVAG